MVKLPKFAMGSSTSTAGGRSTLPLPLWFVRMFQLLLAVVILGLSAADAHDWSSAGCDIPGKVGFNIAAAILTMFAMFYLILSTGKLSILPHIIYAQVPIDFLLTILWIAAAATSRYTCNDLCSNCFPGLDCTCSLEYNKRDLGFSYTRDLGFSLTPRAPRGASHHSSSSGGSSGTTTYGRGNARLALNIIELLTFILTSLATVFFVFKAFTAKKGTTTTGTAAGPAVGGGPQAPQGYQQNGMYPPPMQAGHGQPEYQMHQQPPVQSMNPPYGE